MHVLEYLRLRALVRSDTFVMIFVIEQNCRTTGRLFLILSFFLSFTVLNQPQKTRFFGIEARKSTKSV
jgi:hypothetical protein